MSHFEDTPHTHDCHQEHGTGAASCFDATQVDTLLVFWPDKLVDLSRHGPSQVGSTTVKDAASTALIIGKVISGHLCEAAVVVVGTARAHEVDKVPEETLTSKGFSVVGSLLISGDQGRRADKVLPDCPIWLDVQQRAPAGSLPRIASVHCNKLKLSSGEAPAQKHPTNSNSVPCAVSVISYSVPNSRMLQYFSLESLRLAPVSGMKLVATASALLLPDAQLTEYSRLMAANAEPTMLENKYFQLLLLDPVHWRSLRCVQPDRGRMQRGTALRRSIELINQLQTKHERLARPSSATKLGNGGNPELDTGEQSLAGRIGHVVTSCALALQKALRHPLYTPNHSAVWSQGVAQYPHKQMPRASPLRLTSISACARQLDVRVSQLIVAPRLASRLRYLRKQQKLPIDEIAAPYIGLWNAIWLIANDLILGYAASVMLLQYQSGLASLGRILVARYLHDWVLWLLSWLENWPGGLKLNTELSLFFSDAYSSLTSAWHTQGLVHVLPRLELVMVAMAIVGRWMGVTMVLCMVQDLVSICTLHITIFYTLSFRTLRAFVYVLSALSDVFRGKKRNALRGGRLDDASYDMDQLLLGTLLFTLVAFLFPTVYVYYLAFGLVRLGVVAFEVGLIETGLGLLNHLPLFAIMLRLKDPHRLPAGVWLQEIKVEGAREGHPLHTDRFKLRSRPLTMGDIFAGYGQHVGGLLEVPSMILRCIFGRPLRRSVSPNH